MLGHALLPRAAATAAASSRRAPPRALGAIHQGCRRFATEVKIEEVSLDGAAPSSSSTPKKRRDRSFVDEAAARLRRKNRLIIAAAVTGISSGVLVGWTCGSLSRRASKEDAENSSAVWTLVSIQQAIDSIKGFSRNAFSSAMRLFGIQESEPDYGSVDYWKQRYVDDQDPYDWLGEYDVLGPWIEKAAASAKRIVYLGCGTSVLPEQMHDTGGFGEICSIDVAGPGLDVMRERNRTARPALKWLEADLRDMSVVVANNEFDAAIDKSVLDSIGDQGRDTEVTQYVSEVARVLRPGGTFLVFSFAPPKARQTQLEKDGLFRCKAQVAANCCWAYFCRHAQGDAGATGGDSLKDLEQLGEVPEGVAPAQFDRGRPRLREVLEGKSAGCPPASK